METTAALDAYEKILGAAVFKDVFKSITVDNGSEFADYARMKTSCFEPAADRTAFYYCHAFNSWERGSNENANKLIRRFIPKGSRIERYSVEDVTAIQQWINTYPRLIFDWKCSAQLYGSDLSQLSGIRIEKKKQQAAA